MNKLLSADFLRLRKNKVFIVGSLSMLAISLLTMISGISYSIKFAGDADFGTLDAFYFNTAPYIGIICSVIISLFLGAEYSNGTIRNKLITGHTKDSIYLSNLAVSTAVAETVSLFWAFGGLVGIPHFGLWQKTAAEVAAYFSVIFFSSAAIAAILTFISTMITNRTASAITQIFVSAGMILTGSIIYNRLCEPETTFSNVVITMDGVVPGEVIPNPNYVGGTARSVLTAVLNILPAGQTILADESKISIPIFNLLASVAIIIVFTILGIVLFRKKDLK